MMLADGASDKNMLALMMMSQQGGMDFTKNPMMLYFLMNDKGKSDDMLPFLMMMSGGTFGNSAVVSQQV